MATPIVSARVMLKSPLWHRTLAQAALAVCLLCGCPGKVEQFIGARVEDPCNHDWNVCDTVVGCLIGGTSYISGRFPGTQQVGIQVFEPSNVTVTFLLEEAQSAGMETDIDLWEDACRARTRITVTGKDFFAEADKTGQVTRTAQLSGVGDHLIDFTSDARATYLFKVDVIPTRLMMDSQGP
jgi:hypothetical protein